MARPRRQHVLAPLLAALTLAGCTSGGAPTPPAFPVVSTTPSAAHRSLSLEDQATQLAMDVIEKYWRSLPRCLTDPRNAPDNCFDDVAISTELDTLKNALNAARQVESTTTGSVTVVSMRVLSIDLTNRVSETPPTVPKVTLRVCTDSSQFLVLDKGGRSLSSPSRKPRSFTDMTVVNYKLPEPSEWRVGYQVSEGIAC